MAFTLKCMKLNNEAYMPTRASTKAAGYDLYSAIDCTIQPNQVMNVSTQIGIELPDGHYGRIAGRSGLALHHSIGTLGGVIDGDYIGDIGVILINLKDTPYSIRKGDRIAQLILEKISTPELVEVHKLSQTERGECGFGSTGV